MAESQITGSLDAVFKKLETDIAVMEAKKNNLQTELNTLDANKSSISVEIGTLRELQKDEEKKLGEYRHKQSEIEQESMKKIAEERLTLEGKKEEADTAVAALAEQLQSIKEREEQITATTNANTERGEALNRQADDIEMREGQIRLDREHLDTRQAELEALALRGEAAQADANTKLEQIATERTALTTLHESVQKQAQENEAAREQINNRQIAAEAAEAKAKAATTRMEQFYALSLETAQRVQVAVTAADQTAVNDALIAWYVSIGYTPAAV